MYTLILGILLMNAASMLWGIALGAGPGLSGADRSFRLIVLGLWLISGVLLWTWWWTT